MIEELRKPRNTPVVAPIICAPAIFPNTREAEGEPQDDYPTAIPVPLDDYAEDEMLSEQIMIRDAKRKREEYDRRVKKTRFDEKMKKTQKRINREAYTPYEDICRHGPMANGNPCARSAEPGEYYCRYHRRHNLEEEVYASEEERGRPQKKRRIECPETPSLDFDDDDVEIDKLSKEQRFQQMVSAAVAHAMKQVLDLVPTSTAVERPEQMDVDSGNALPNDHNS